MANQDFNSTVSSLFQGMDNFITSKTVVGEPKQVGDVILLPLIEVAFGVGAGAFLDKDGNNRKSTNVFVNKITFIESVKKSEDKKDDETDTPVF